MLSAEVRAVSGGADAGSVVSDEMSAVAAGADCGRVSALVSAASSVGDDRSRVSVATVSDRRAVVDVFLSPLRNRRHVSEDLC